MTVRRSCFRLTALTLATLTFASCAATTVEVQSEDGKVNVGGSFETVPTTTTPILGTAQQLVGQMADDMSRLSTQIAGDGDEKATLQRIDAIWLLARPELDAAQPELVDPIDTTVGMARTAVVRIRPADADKAFQLLTNLAARVNASG